MAMCVMAVAGVARPGESTQWGGRLCGARNCYTHPVVVHGDDQRLALRQGRSAKHEESVNGAAQVEPAREQRGLNRQGPTIKTGESARPCWSRSSFHPPPLAPRCAGGRRRGGLRETSCR